MPEHKTKFKKGDEVMVRIGTQSNGLSETRMLPVSEVVGKYLNLLFMDTTLQVPKKEVVLVATAKSLRRKKR